MLKHLILTALLCAASALAVPDAPLLCRVVIYTDYNLFGAGYYAVPQLAPECADNAVGRLRKSSTLNTKRQGAAFQPIHPVTGAWNVTFYGDDVPNSEQFVYFFSTWEWQWYNGKRWIPAVVL